VSYLPGVEGTATTTYTRARTTTPTRIHHSVCFDFMMLILTQTRFFAIFQTRKYQSGGDDVRKFEPRKWLKFKDIDKSIQELRRIYKVHPEWFEIPKPKSDKGKNELTYTIS